MPIPFRPLCLLTRYTSGWGAHRGCNWFTKRRARLQAHNMLPADLTHRSLTFTCTANDCGHRSTHEFTKRSYTRGIVLVQCPECKNRHLIADHLGWFKVCPAVSGRISFSLYIKGSRGREVRDQASSQRMSKRMVSPVGHFNAADGCLLADIFAEMSHRVIQVG